MNATFALLLYACTTIGIYSLLSLITKAMLLNVVHDLSAVHNVSCWILKFE